MTLFDFLILRCPVQNLNDVFPAPKKLPQIFEEGLFLASRTLFTQLKKFDHLSNDEKARLKASLLKYWVRASIRSTPFGTFAGTAVVNLAQEDSEIILNESQYHYRQVRLDMEYLSFLVSQLEKIPIVQDQILLYKNNSIYETPLDLRYCETITANFQKDYKLASVEKSNYLAFVLDKAESGISIKELSKSLTVFATVEFYEAEQFVKELWNSNLLVSDLEPCLTGAEPFQNLLYAIKGYTGINNIKEKLAQVLEYLINPQEGVLNYLKAETLLKQLFPPPESLKSFFQTDLFLSLEKKKINIGIIQSIAKQVEDLTFISRKANSTELEVFKKKFLDRYGDNMIPLPIALDADIGIGFAGINDISGSSKLIDDIDYVSIESERGFMDTIQKYTLSKYLEYIKDNSECIEIKESEINRFKANLNNSHFPNSMHIHGALMKDEGLLNSDNFLFHLMSVGGPSAGNLLGRFTQGSEELLKLTKNVLNKEEEENPDIIFAEVVHLPQARIGNVLLRPVLRDYEIPYIGKSGVRTTNQILITDLYLCVKDNEIVLVSKKFNKRVVPRLTTAHNFQFGSLPIYKFLCDLQYQNIAMGAIWDWGNLEQINHLPRVIYKSIILKKARWKIELSEISDLPYSQKDYKTFFDAFNISRKIPQRVLLVESDNQILIDFTEEHSIFIFLTFINKQKTVVLEEFLSTKENCIIKDKENQPYANEIIIPVHKSTNVTPKLKTYEFKKSTATDKYQPGSEWLFLKVFCSAKTMDDLLVRHLLPFVKSKKHKPLFDKFFFIRYKEHGDHLRIRFHVKNTSNQYELLTNFNKRLKPLLKIDVIQRIVIDTYIPETERYGGPNLLKLSEELFGNDSFATLKILNLLDLGAENNHRLFISMKSIDAFMTDFNYSVTGKRDFFKNLSQIFLIEFGASSLLQKNINKKYGDIKRLIFSFMDRNQDSNNDMLEVAKILNRRSLENTKSINLILACLEQNRSAISLNDLVASHVHMMINRIFISHQRKYELMIYHFLERYYTSLISINKFNSTSQI